MWLPFYRHFTVSEEHAPGAKKLLTELLVFLKPHTAAPIEKKLNADLIKELGEASKDYKVPVVKTKGVIPYSSSLWTVPIGRLRLKPS